ncbi:MAG: hypothetical protein J5970_01150 [Bacilli bacterium]|nr:hypothetical protein [Bacilli bacterium]
MLKEVKYYNRAYKLLEEIREIYSDGFNPERTYSFWEEKNRLYNENHLLFLERMNSLKLTTMIALFGLNKESIEKKEKYLDYDEFVLDLDFRKFEMPNILSKNDFNDGIRRFETYRNQNTIFDNWLSIHVPVSSDNSNKDIFRRVRNGLLHSNFDLEMDSLGISYTHIKTKRYYESIILNQNFEQLVKGYFSNCGPLGLSENDIILDFRDRDINNKQELIQFLFDTDIYMINNTVDKYNGQNYLGNYFDYSKKRIDTEYLKRTIKRMKNDGINIKGITGYNLDEISIIKVEKQINRFYPDFYSYDHDKKLLIIKGAILSVIDVKSEISNWLLHFDYIAQSITEYKFDVNDPYIKTEINAKETCEPALAILKAYLIMYRMQYVKNNPSDTNKFEELRYDLVDFDLDDGDYQLTVENSNDSTFNYQTLVNRKLQGNPNMDMDEINKRIVCEIIRDGLAHGNIYPYYEIYKNEDAIMIKDINPRNPDEVKVLQMTLDKFNKFLDSEAFKPKYCLNRNRTLN